MRIVMTAAALCALAGPAWAQGVLETPAGGVRLELVAGWDRPVLRVQSDGSGSIGAGEVTGGQSGVSYGGEVGYDMATSSATFIGGYAGLAGSTASVCTAPSILLQSCIHAGRNLTVGVRAGLMSRGVAFYAKGGWSNGQINAETRSSLLPALNARGSDTLDGFHVGLGLQARLPGRAYAKLEYVFTNYNGFEDALGGSRIKADFDRHQISGGLGVRF
ncbi:porin family protein [Sphingomonas sp. R1]|uniref:porin family protein n=1 Tax=Sphingomonas sp. R1 TaxID=399176 RepID=UPI0022248B69|nr:porin family protein [Sphingomonas sp. R1]UYY79537.1 porin family protein [Sphingomonas sp. R1]